MFKINWKKIASVTVWLLLILLLFYTRGVNLGWGLPYPMHPDERNMAMAIENLNCRLPPTEFNFSTITKCFNPHFFAYGQFNLYLAYLIALILKFLDGDFNTVVSFSEAVVSLRIISFSASILNFFVLLKIIELILGKRIRNISQRVFFSLPLIFIPFFIQFSHFGTTEAVLMLFYSLIVYLNLKLIQLKKDDFLIKKKRLILLIGLMTGLAAATKVSSLIFILPSVISLLDINYYFFKKEKNFLWLKRIIVDCFLLIFLTGFFLVIFSPYNFLAWREFSGAFNYESGVALGKIDVFYTRQFKNTIPIVFQITKIFPYVLGWLSIFFYLGFVFLSWRKKEINFLRWAILAYFIPNAFLYAKWTRFMAPIFPLMLIIAVIFLQQVKTYFKKNKISHFLFLTFYLFLLLPGIGYLAVYKGLDSRFQASIWSVKNIPPGSYILSETANVVDVPFVLPEKMNFYSNYTYISFNFYDLDLSEEKFSELKNHLSQADYIFVPSRRIFRNHYCQKKNEKISGYFFNHCQYLKKTYPLLNQYYDALFNGRLGFKKVAEFTSYPKIELFNKK
ncbi:MAG: ArnT family glycosyltransferase, partial [Microgenomates group bacterium]